MKLRILVFAGLLLFAGLFVGMVKDVQAAATVTPEMVTRIRARCTENQAALNRLHQTDAFLRTNRGDLYRTIGDKLMVPLNRRLAANRLDGATLLTITSDYNSEYTRFYNAYIQYDNALSEVLKIDCNREPVGFYNALLEAREKRIVLSGINQAIKDKIRQYGVSFTEFKAEFERQNP